ncbi:hypothetical protein [Streptomyces yerevanensis]|uniref:hypothetical protein n=1 Tax=Streptomyces yerevanensis TaxID=66378 RepID=UPI000526CFC4|nr:hypothetical protein [Streptomyces yerevanensis]
MTASGTHTANTHDCGCGCGGGTATTLTAPAGFRAGGPVRPVFFAGQLLNEDDLGRLAAWTTGLARAHNRLRYVSAEGHGAVLCGLSVSCNSCTPGAVRVGAGHAVDGSGNDIPVICAEHVDVVALAREFRTSGGGCPDPCPPGPERTYGLFLRYDEEFAEPEALYDAGDGSTTVGCVPTRVREGHRFSLGCVPKPAPDRLCALLRRRFGDDRKFLTACQNVKASPSADDLTAWLTARLDVNGDLCDRAPLALLCDLPPKKAPGKDVRRSWIRKEGAWYAFEAYLRAAVRSLLVVPCPVGCDPHVLIATVTLDGCDVVRAVPSGRRVAHLTDPVEQQWRTRLARIFEHEVTTQELLDFLHFLLDLTGCLPQPSE